MVSVKEMFVSFTENVKDKTSSPFFGTLVLVWLIKNYYQIYVLLFSGTNTTYECKTGMLNQMFDFSWENDKQYIGWTFLILVISIVLVLISKLLVHIYTDIGIPFVQWLTSKSKIKLKVDYIALEKERDELGTKLNDSEKEVREANNRRKENESAINQLRGELANMTGIKIDEEREKENAIKKGQEYFDQKETLQKRLTESEANLKSIEDIYKKAEHQIDEIAHDVLALRNNLEREKIENESLRKELGKLREKEFLSIAKFLANAGDTTALQDKLRHFSNFPSDFDAPTNFAFVGALNQFQLLEKVNGQYKFNEKGIAFINYLGEF